VSLRDPATLSVLCVKIVILRPDAKLLFPVKAAKDPPLALPETLEVGMLCPAPSVRAALVLLVNAYSVIVSGGTETSHCVVMVICELPEPTPFRGSVKLTAEGAADTVRVWPWEHLQTGPARHTRANTAFHKNPFRLRRDTTILDQEL
jgi:hypothetical protein